MTPEGPDARVRDMVALVTGLHNFSASRARTDGAAFAWDEWMSQSVTFYTPSLSPFLERFRALGTPYLARAHAAPDATRDDPMASTLYSDMVEHPMKW